MTSSSVDDDEIELVLLLLAFFPVPAIERAWYPKAQAAVARFVVRRMVCKF